MGVVDLHGIAGKSAAPVDNTIEFEREIHRSALNCDPCKTCKPHDRGLDSGYGLHVGLYVTVEDHGVKVHHHVSSAEAKEQDQHSQTQHLSTAGLPVAGHSNKRQALQTHQHVRLTGAACKDVASDANSRVECTVEEPRSVGSLVAKIPLLIARDG